MAKPHKPFQQHGHQRVLAARTATDTESTVGGVHPSDGTAPRRSARSENVETFKAPPPRPSEHLEGGLSQDKPVTFAHVATAYRVTVVIVAVVVTLVTITWNLSSLATKGDKNTESIKDIQGKTDKLVSDAAVTAVKLNALEEKTSRIENIVQQDVHRKPR